MKALSARQPTVSPAGRGRRTVSAPSKRRNEILDAALEVLNARGAAAQMVDLVATRCGLDRASLYYYVGSREELIFAAYQRSYEQLNTSLETARHNGHDTLDRIERLVHAIVLSPTQTASLNEIGLLTPEHRMFVEAQRTVFWRGLENLLDEGARDGSMNAFTPNLAARALEGALTLGIQWLRSDGTQPREGLAAAVAEMIMYGRRPAGAAFQRRYAQPAAMKIETLAAGWGDAISSDQKREAMLRAASRLINQRGVNGMTLDGIVGALGVTKGAFYHYFDNKDDLIFRCYTRSQVITERYIATVEDEGGLGLERLQRASFHNVSIQLSAAGPLTLFTGFGSLPKEMRELVRSRAAVASAAMREMAYRGIEDGSCRRYPVAVGQRVFGGASAWIGTWRESSGPSAEEIIDTFIPLYTNGLKRRPEKS